MTVYGRNVVGSQLLPVPPNEKVLSRVSIPGTGAVLASSLKMYLDGAGGTDNPGSPWLPNHLYDWSAGAVNVSDTTWAYGASPRYGTTGPTFAWPSASGETYWSRTNQVLPWAPSTAVANGASVIGGSRVWYATTGGTTGTTAPNWASVTIYQGAITDGTVTWVLTGAWLGEFQASHTYDFYGYLTSDGVPLTIYLSHSPEAYSYTGYSIRTSGSSGATYPLFPADPASSRPAIIDNEIVWQWTDDGPYRVDQVAKAVVYDASAAFVAAGPEFTVAKNQGAAWVDCPLPADTPIRNGYLVGIHGGPGLAIRVAADPDLSFNHQTAYDDYSSGADPVVGGNNTALLTAGGVPSDENPISQGGRWHVPTKPFAAGDNFAEGAPANNVMLEASGVIRADTTGIYPEGEVNEGYASAALVAAPITDQVMIGRLRSDGTEFWSDPSDSGDSPRLAVRLTQIGKPYAQSYSMALRNDRARVRKTLKASLGPWQPNTPYDIGAVVLKTTDDTRAFVYQQRMAGTTGPGPFPEGTGVADGDFANWNHNVSYVAGTVWAPSTAFAPIGGVPQALIINGDVMVAQYGGVTGTTEPDWSAVTYQVQVGDGGELWMNRGPFKGVWHDHTRYVSGVATDPDIPSYAAVALPWVESPVNPGQLFVSNYINGVGQSGATEPAWPPMGPLTASFEGGPFVADNDASWSERPSNLVEVTLVDTFFFDDESLNATFGGLATGDFIKLTAIGSTISVWVRRPGFNWFLAGSFTDMSLPGPGQGAVEFDEYDTEADGGINGKWISVAWGPP